MKRILVLLFFSLSFLDAAQEGASNEEKRCVQQDSPAPRRLYQPGPYGRETNVRPPLGCVCPLASINEAWHQKVKSVQHTSDPKTGKKYNLLKKDTNDEFPIASVLSQIVPGLSEDEARALLHCMVHCGGCVVMPSDIERAKQNGYGPLLPPAKR